MKSKKLIKLLLILTIFIGLTYLGLSFYTPSVLSPVFVRDFDSCTRAEGSVILESYPEQCRAINGDTFVRELSKEDRDRLENPENYEEETISIETEVKNEVSIDMSDWQTYEADEYEFTLDHPQNFGVLSSNPEEKLLFGLFNAQNETKFEFWIQELNGETLEDIFEEKLELDDISYFNWIQEAGGSIRTQKLGENTWLFVDGSQAEFTISNYLLKLPEYDAYLVVDLGIVTDEELQMAKAILGTLTLEN